MLQEASFEMTAVAFQKERDADKNLYVQFYSDVIEDRVASEKEGRPIFAEKDFVLIMVPGDKYNIIRRPVQPRDLQRFAERYHAFKMGKSQEAAAGTPLATVTWLTKALVKELEFFGCTTLEQLANMPDSSAQKFMAIQGLKQRARDHIQAAKEAAPLLTIRSEIEKKDIELTELRNALKQTQLQLAQMQNTILQQAASGGIPQQQHASKK